MSFFETVRAVALRSRGTLVQDAFGAAALMVILVTSLHIPALV